MNQKHTPGPWTYVSMHEAGRSDCFEIAQVNHWYIVPDREHTSIDQEGDDISDARLIATAPELLEALKEATRCLAWHQERHGVGMDKKAVEDARAAIAKATGGAE